MEDHKHCLRIPTKYVPRYVSEMSRIIKDAFTGEDHEMLMEEEKRDSEMHLVNELAKSYPWNISVNLKMGSKIIFVECKNH